MGLEFLIEGINGISNQNREGMMKEISDNILTVKAFTAIIEEKVSELQCTYLEALTQYAEDNNIEIETIGALVKSSHVLKAKLAVESEELKLIKPVGARLPISDD